MSGNVWEWTRSLWGKDWQKPIFRYPYHPDDGREALEASDDIHRVLRGGSFWNRHQFVRCAYRNRNDPQNVNNNVGFRIVVAVRTSVVISIVRRGHRLFRAEVTDGGACSWPRLNTSGRAYSNRPAPWALCSGAGHAKAHMGRCMRSSVPGRISCWPTAVPVRASAAILLWRPLNTAWKITCWPYSTLCILAPTSLALTRTSSSTSPNAA
jgi:Sulfatase-modifying factor enzyme 1